MTTDHLALEITAGDRACAIVQSYVSHNPVSREDLQSLIRATHSTVSKLYGVAVSKLYGVGAPPEAEPVKLTPAVPIEKSVTPEAIYSLEDGKPYKSLRRHLTARGMTVEQYRAKWNLPADYPVVAAAYSATRSALAKRFGLGRKD